MQAGKKKVLFVNIKKAYEFGNDCGTAVEQPLFAAVSLLRGRRFAMLRFPAAAEDRASDAASFFAPKR